MDVSLEQIKRAKNGDSLAFGEIYDAYAQKLYRYIKLRVSSKQQAEDILQEVFLKSWKGLENLSLVNLNFTAWLFRIASNTINDFFRKHYRSPATVELNDQALSVKDPVSPAQNLQKDQDKEILMAALEKLSPQYKEILSLRFIQEFDVKESAKITGKSSLSIRVSQHRALKKLRKILESENDLQH